MVLYSEIGRDWRWYCQNIISVRKQAANYCNTEVSIRTGTFFVISNLIFYKILGFSHLWAKGLQLRHIKRKLAIGSDHTLVD